MGRESRLAFTAWEWAEHRQPGNVWLHVSSNGVGLTLLLLLVAKIHLPLGSEPSLAWFYLGALTLYHARLDWPTAVLAGGVLLGITGAWRGEFVGEHDHSVRSVALLLGAYGAVGLPALWGHAVYWDRDVDHLSDPPGGHRGRVLTAIFTGWPVYLLLVLLRRGYRPALRSRVEARALEFYRAAHGRPWHNWSRTQHCRPETTWYPRTVAELQEIVVLARQTSRRIRVVGTSYSWPPLVCTDQFMICLRLLDSIEIQADAPGGPRVWVGAGVVGRQLNEALERAGLCLSSNVVMETVSWGGLVSVGAHGSGWNESTLSDMVEQVELVDGRGRLRTFRCGEDSAEVMNAVRVCLGMCGIIVRVALRVQPAFNVRLTDRKVRVTEMLAMLPDAVPRHDYFDVFWFPGTEHCWIRMWDRVDEPTSPPRIHAPWSVSTQRTTWGRWSAWWQSTVYNLCAGLFRRWPALTTPVMRISNLAIRDHTRVVHVHDATHYRGAIEVHRLGCIEFAFGMQPDMADVRRAWRDIEQTMESFSARGHYPLNMTVNVRFIGGSDCLLAASHGNAHTCFIEALGDPRQPQWIPLTEALGRRWMKLPNARPHWPKQHRGLPGMQGHFRRVLGHELGRVLAIREQLDLDPDRMFVNPYIEWLEGAARPAAGEASGRDDPR